MSPVAYANRARVRHTPETVHFDQLEEALVNEDILHLIFEHFDLEPGSQTIGQTRKYLLSAAKACKAFSEPALNSLWRVLPSLLPLLLLLPSAKVIDGQYFVDDLPFSNWERFEVHARRVRILYMETPNVVISPVVYLRIRGMRDGPLLPGLKAIYIPDHNPIDLPSIIFLALGGPLDVVELNHSAISERNFFIPFLTLLASKSPQLGHLALRGTGNVSLEPLYCLTKLKRLEIRLPGTYLYPQTLRILGNMINLLDLTLDVGASTPPPVIDTQMPTSSPSTHINCGMLRRLHIIGTPGSITRVLDDINLTSLTALVIDEAPDNAGGHTKSFWKRCFGQVSVCQAMEDIEINQLMHRSRGHENYSLSTSWFISLFDLRNVKSLVINGSALSGSDEDFRRMACAFPRLKKLVVPPAYYSQGRTLECLFHFAQECPDLLEIKICLASDIDENLDAVNYLPRPIAVNYRHPLQKIYINSQLGQMQPTQMIQVAQFLDLLFPNLVTLETYDSDSTETPDWLDSTETSNWTAIHQMCMVLQTTRRDAFRLATSEMDHGF